MEHPVFSSLSQNTLRVSALNAIRENILNGVLRPGQQLVQADIAAQMNISRAPVREALRQLEEEGLVESVPYRGTSVARLSRRDILEVFTLRGALEGLALRLAITCRTDEELMSLPPILDEMSEAAQGKDYAKLNSADIRFHTELCRLADHRHLIRSWEMNINLIRRILALRNKLSPFQVVVDMHRPIVAAVLARDAQAAQAAIEDHCINSGETLAALWAEDK